MNFMVTMRVAAVLASRWFGRMWFGGILLAGALASAAMGQGAECSISYRYLPAVNEFVSGWPLITLLIRPNVLDIDYIDVTTNGKTTRYYVLGGFPDQHRFEVFKDNIPVAGGELTDLEHMLQSPQYCGPDFAVGMGNPPQAQVRPKVMPASLSIRGAGQYNGRVAINDLNGDGIPDAVSVSGSSISITLIGGDGTPISTAFIPVTGLGRSIVATDLNGDGRVDLAVTQTDSSGQGNVAILLGNGDGTFKPPVKYSVGTQSALNLDTGDFNGDGIADLAVTTQDFLHSPAAQSAGTVTVLLGKGDGSFSSAGVYAVGKFPGSIVAADFTGDGILDLAALEGVTGVANQVNKVWVLRGKGDGTFLAAVSTATGTGDGYLSYSDLNNDGFTDLIIADKTASAMTIMFGNGDGSFKAPTAYVASAQPISIAPLKLEDKTTFLETADNLTQESFLTDIGADGKVPCAPLQTLGKGPAAIAAADLNGDGKPDLVISDSSAGTIYVELGTGGGKFSNPSAYSLQSQPGALALADVNRDGSLDVIAADYSGLDVLPGKGDGTLGTVKTTAYSGPLSSVAVADFNRDGKLDVAAAAGASGVALFLGNGDGTFRNGGNIALGNGLIALNAVSADLNGDGIPDLVVAGGAGDFVSAGRAIVLLGKGDGGFQNAVSITLPGAFISQAMGAGTTAALSVADINGDGHLDIVTAVSNGGVLSVVVLPGNGDGSFQAPVLTRMIASPPMIAVADFNGDGKPDLLLADCCGLSEAGFMAGNGDGTFQAERTFPSGPEPRGIAIGDFDRDGSLDAAIIGQAGASQGTLTVLYGVFSAILPHPSISAIASAASGGITTLAPSSIAAAYGNNLATGIGTPAGSGLPTSLAGTTVVVTDATKTPRPAALFYVSPTQIDFEVPDGTAAGNATVTITSGNGSQGSTSVAIASVSPSVFQLNADGLAAAIGVVVAGDGSQSFRNVYQTDASGKIAAMPIDLGQGQIYLEIYGTGIRNTSNVSATVGGQSVPVLSAGAQGAYAGLDQVNIGPLPVSLKGRGTATIVVTADGHASNPVNVVFQ